MNTFTPCTEWEEQLAARHPEDLSLAEHIALNKHMATCSACAETYADYDLLTSCIRALPQSVMQPLPHFLFASQKQEEQMIAHDNLVAISLAKKSDNIPAPRYSRFAHSLNIASAILAVAVIIVSAFFLFTPHQGTIVSGTGNVSSLPQSKVVGGYTVTIKRAYADINEVIIGYTVKDRQNHTLDQQHIWLDILPTTRQGPILPGGGTGNGFDGNEFLGMQSVAFDTSAIPASTRILNVHLTANLALMPTPPLTPPVNANVSVPQIGQTSFDFSVPFHTGRVINMHQTVTVHGVSLTLERVVVTRSETRISVLFPKALGDIVNNTGNNTFYLSVGNQHLLPPSMTNMQASIMVLHFHSPLYSEHGVWTLQFQITTPKQNVGTLTFHFVVPA
ncbi:MAG: hypothetical protein ACYDER_06735 [Ktedonobacteraceae bacterium]